MKHYHIHWIEFENTVLLQFYSQSKINLSVYLETNISFVHIVIFNYVTIKCKCSEVD